MIKKMFQQLVQPVRSILSVEQVLQQQTQLIVELKAQRHQLDRVASYLEFATIDDTRMRESNKYRNFHEIIPLLTPMDVLGAKYRRVGRDFDGGYVMLDDFSSRKIDAAYSFGINDDVSWDEAMAALGMDIFMYDHTIEKLPKQNSRFHFFKEGVTGDPEEKGLETLTRLVARNGHQKARNLILKMDVEGYEWDVFEETSSDVMGQFSQIVLEWHGLNPNKPKADLAKVLAVLKKINQTHQAIHVHANGYCPVSWLGAWVLPHVLEVTYIRRSDYADRLVRNTRSFPTKLDQPTFPWLPDVPLGTFSTETKGK